MQIAAVILAVAFVGICVVIPMYGVHRGHKYFNNDRMIP